MSRISSDTDRSSLSVAFESPKSLLSDLAITFTSRSQAGTIAGVSTERPFISPAFEDEAREAVERLRAALAVLLDALNLSEVPALELARALRLDKSLGWKINHLSAARDVATLREYMPGNAGWDIFLSATRKAGADPKLISAVRSSVGAFHDLVERHAGDAATFGMLVGGLGGAGAQRVELAHRRQLFQGASYVWGIQVRVLLHVHFVAVAEDPARLDCAILRGLLDVRRLRRDSVCVLGPYHLLTDSGDIMQAALRPVDPDYGAPGQVPFLGKFCSQPLPEARRVRQPDGTGYDLLEVGPVGKPGSVTLITGEYSPASLSRFRSESDTSGRHMAWVRVPAESLVLDVYIDRALEAQIKPALDVLSRLEAIGAAPNPPFTVQLPISEQLEALGPAPVVRPAAVVRDYNRMIQTVCDRAGWRPEQFNVYRIHVKYPPIASCAHIHYALPSA